VPRGEFFFALQLPNDASTSLVSELVARVCRAVCQGPDRADELSASILAGVQEVLVRDSELRFEAQGGILAVTVWTGPTCTWRTVQSVG